jgi:hypothetical protein
LGIEQVTILTSDVLVVDHNSEKFSLTTFAVIGSNYSALGVQNHLVLVLGVLL